MMIKKILSIYRERKSKVRSIDNDFKILLKKLEEIRDCHHSVRDQFHIESFDRNIEVYIAGDPKLLIMYGDNEYEVHYFNNWKDTQTTYFDRLINFNIRNSIVKKVFSTVISRKNFKTRKEVEEIIEDFFGIGSICSRDKMKEYLESFCVSNALFNSMSYELKKDFDGTFSIYRSGKEFLAVKMDSKYIRVILKDSTKEERHRIESYLLNVREEVIVIYSMLEDKMRTDFIGFIGAVDTDFIIKDISHFYEVLRKVS